MLIWINIGMLISVAYHARFEIATKSQSVGDLLGDMMGFLFVSFFWPITLAKIVGSYFK